MHRGVAPKPSGVVGPPPTRHASAEAESREDPVGALFDLFAEDALGSVAEPAWDATLTRRLRALLHAMPLLQLRLGDARRDEELRHYDSLTLATRALDVIADQMGLESEASRETLVRALTPLLEAMDTRAGVLPDGARHRRMVDRVLAGLRNDDDAQRPWVYPYTELDEDGQAVVREVRFRLVQDAFGASGGTVLRLSHEAVNLLFHALEFDLEDAQTATEAIVQSQLHRGLFQQAARSATNALRQSRMYREKLLRVLRETRRDVDRVDWHKDVPLLLDDALLHIDHRLDTERAILATATSRLDHLEPGTEAAAMVARVAELVTSCMRVHMELQRDLMNARSTFLDAQARQSFVPTPRSPRPALARDVLDPVLELRARDAIPVTDRAIETMSSARPRDVFSLAHLVEGLLRPPRHLAPVVHDPADATPVAGPLDLSRYDQSMRDAAKALLRTATAPTPLSSLLRGERDEIDDLVVLYALQQLDPEGAGARWLEVRALTGTPLRHPRFVGDELEIRAPGDAGTEEGRA